MSLIFRAWRKLPDGTILWAKQFGLRAWPIEIDDGELKTKDSDSETQMTAPEGSGHQR